MHRVERGPEPPQLGKVQRRYTPAWVRYYRHGRGRKPTDSRWREFQPVLSQRFFDLCAYCEEYCKGDIDHFRPKSRYPELVYEWTNWVLACNFCNNKKREQWPPCGYVDPCATTTASAPESYFTFDTKTGEMLPRKDLSATRRQRAFRTIEDLGLNHYHHLKKRVQWLTAITLVLGGSLSDTMREKGLSLMTSVHLELSSITRQLLKEKGYAAAPE